MQVVNRGRCPQVRLRGIAHLEKPGARRPLVKAAVVPAILLGDAERPGRALDDVGEEGVAVRRGDRVYRGLQALVVGKQVVRPPAVGAECRPLLQVTAQRAPGDHRVGGGAAAEDAEAGQADVGVAALVRFRAVVQVVLALEHLVPEPERAGPGLVLVVGPPLDQRHVTAGLGQAGREQGTRRAPAHDQVIELRTLSRRGCRYAQSHALLFAFLGLFAFLWTLAPPSSVVAQVKSVQSMFLSL